jgi:tetratricopeptide (TPR) repeat protein
MKKLAILLSLGLFLFAYNGYAQKSARTSAYMYNKDGKLDKAKEEIDKAAKHPKTINDPKTWLYRAIIYYGIATSPLPAFKNLDTNAIYVALKSLEKAKELDVKHKYEDDINLNFNNIYNAFLGFGADYFNDKKYDKSLKAFEYAMKTAQILGISDTLPAYNAGISAINAKKPELAAKFLKECIDNDFKEPKVYIYYSKSLKHMGDTAGAIEALNIGRKRYPDNLSILLNQAQNFLEKGESDKLIAYLKEAIAKDPQNKSNANYYLLIGQSYDQMGKQDSAVYYYKKATEIKPDFYDAYYSIGAIYVNNGVEIQKEASDLPLEETEKYNALQAKATDYFKKGLPWLEKALELNPEDAETLGVLKQVYVFLKMNDKLKALNEKYK